MFIENGRIADEPGKPFKSALREIAKAHKGTFRLTANQHLILAEVDPEHLELMKTLLAKHRLDNTDFSGLRLSSSACVAFPTCGLAMAESERVSNCTNNWLYDEYHDFSICRFLSTRLRKCARRMVSGTILLSCG
jgi:sulfite reductase beta subunit-like hemoprotein